MSTLAPPVQLASPQSRYRIEYVLNLVNQKDFEFPSVSKTVSHKEHNGVRLSLPFYHVAYSFK